MNFNKKSLLIYPLLIVLTIFLVIYQNESNKNNELVIFSKMIVDENSSKERTNYFLININTDEIADLLQLDGIGEVKANAIIEYRKKNGNFKEIADIMNVDGIGESTFSDIKSYIRVE